MIKQCVSRGPRLNLGLGGAVGIVGSLHSEYGTERYTPECRSRWGCVRSAMIAAHVKYRHSLPPSSLFQAWESHRSCYAATGACKSVHRHPKRPTIPAQHGFRRSSNSRHTSQSENGLEISHSSQGKRTENAALVQIVLVPQAVLPNKLSGKKSIYTSA